MSATIFGNSLSIDVVVGIGVVGVGVGIGIGDDFGVSVFGNFSAFHIGMYSYLP